MGSAQRNIYPDGGDNVPELNGSDTSLLSFNGTQAIQAHLDHTARLKDYLCARTKIMPDIPLTCHSECLVACWLHSESGKGSVNRKLLDSVCRCCEQFQEIAAQAVLLTKRDLPEPVSIVLQSALDFEHASVKFQEALAELHIECGFNQ